MRAVACLSHRHSLVGKRYHISQPQVGAVTTASNAVCLCVCQHGNFSTIQHSMTTSECVDALYKSHVHVYSQCALFCNQYSCSFHTAVISRSHTDTLQPGRSCTAAFFFNFYPAAKLRPVLLLRYVTRHMPVLQQIG